MAEPTTTTAGLTLAAALGISLAAALTGIDGNALVGAFAGATLFVISSRELGAWDRIAYLLISIVMGYKAAPEITAHTFIEQTAIAAFVAGLICVTAALRLVDKIKEMDIIAMIKGVKK
jgi:hypothetical protein